jgi:hypothetical protein
MPQPKLKPIEERDPYAARVLEAYDRLASSDSVRPFCACGRRQSECDGSRAGCHSSPRCRRITGQVNHDVCSRCRRRERPMPTGDFRISLSESED